jgi:hypothetical protein
MQLGPFATFAERKVATAVQKCSMFPGHQVQRRQANQLRDPQDDVAAPAAAAEVDAGNVSPSQPPPAADSDAPATPATPPANLQGKGVTVTGRVVQMRSSE